MISVVVDVNSIWEAGNVRDLLPPIHQPFYATPARLARVALTLRVKMVQQRVERHRVRVRPETGDTAEAHRGDH